MHTPHIVCLARISFGWPQSKLIIDKNDEGVNPRDSAAGKHSDS